MKKEQPDLSDSQYETDTASMINYTYQDSLQDSGYVGLAKRRNATPIGKENVPNKKVRKALAPSWSTPGNISVPGVTVTDPSFVVESPVSITVFAYFHPASAELIFKLPNSIFRSNL